MNSNAENQLVSLLCFVAFLAMLYYRRRWRPAGTAFGTATWASESVLRTAGMLTGKGLILARTFSRALLRLPQYSHVLLVGGTGSGKGVSIIIPNLLSYSRGGLICFDTKGDLFESTSERRAAMGQRVVRLAPFNGG